MTTLKKERIMVKFKVPLTAESEKQKLWYLIRFCQILSAHSESDISLSLVKVCVINIDREEKKTTRLE